MRNGVMIAVPIPEEFHAVGQEIQRCIEQAVQESEANGMAQAGNDVTPWLLDRVKELSGGLSMVSNIALLKNNATVGGFLSFPSPSIRTYRVKSR